MCFFNLNKVKMKCICALIDSLLLSIIDFFFMKNLLILKSPKYSLIQFFLVEKSTWVCVCSSLSYFTSFRLLFFDYIFLLDRFFYRHNILKEI